MAEASLAITTEYVRCFFALMGKAVSWPEKMSPSLASIGLDALDVIHVVTHGDATESDKETADGSTMVLVGYTCDQVLIRVKIWIDVNQFNLRILNVTLV
jgi:hypothetical protein